MGFYLWLVESFALKTRRVFSVGVVVKGKLIVVVDIEKKKRISFVVVNVKVRVMVGIWNMCMVGYIVFVWLCYLFTYSFLL